MTKIQRKLWTGIVILALLSPLGIILPEMIHSGDSWGEWKADALENLLGYVPEGLRKYAELWKAPVPDYNLGGDDSSLAVRAISYIASGMIGILFVVLVLYLISKVVIKNEK